MSRTKITTQKFYQEAIKRKKEMQILYSELEERMKKYPDDKILFAHRGKYNAYYHRKESTEKMGTYIQKAELKKYKSLFQKSYDERLLKLINQEMEALKIFMKRYADKTEEIQRLYESYPEEVREMIIPADISDEEFVRRWMSVPFIGKEIKESDNMQRTDLGEIVRSKSELNIANLLYKNGIPYKYECPLILSTGEKIHPDFTVLDVKRRRVVYWEHRGMMDKDTYWPDAVQRVKKYGREGIILGQGLIITEETRDIVLGTSEIERIIHAYFD